MKRKFVNENASGSLFFLHLNSEELGKMTTYSQHDILIKLKREFFSPFAIPRRLDPCGMKSERERKA